MTRRGWRVSQSQAGARPKYAAAVLPPGPAAPVVNQRFTKSTVALARNHAYRMPGTFMTPRSSQYRRGAALPSSNPFQRLASLIEGIPPGMEPIAMTIGEPQHAIPAFTSQVLAENVGDFRRYPPINGTPEFREAVADWLEARYGLDGLIDRDHGVLPLNGSREGLSFGAIAARDQLGKGDEHPIVILPNPFYQTYAAAAHIADAQALLLDATAERELRIVLLVVLPAHRHIARLSTLGDSLLSGIQPGSLEDRGTSH